jgi:peptidoglycan hydrolase-like protein with peptidoglycan-binding domain
MKYGYLFLVLVTTFLSAQSTSAQSFFDESCSLVAAPLVVAPGQSTTLRFVTSRPTVVVLFDEKEYASEATVAVTPEATKVYSAKVKGGLSKCSVTVVVDASLTPVTQTAAVVQSQPVASPVSVTPAATPAAQKSIVCVSDTYRSGDTDSQIKVIQRFLRGQGYNKVKVTGVFDMYTVRAVTHFQNEYASDILAPLGLGEATGEWGMQTATKASQMGLCVYDEEDATNDTVDEQATAPADVCYALVIEPETKSDTVKSIQKFLRSQGYTKVTVSGYYGPLTKKAISSFQTEHKKDILTPSGFKKATGVWGPATAAKASELGLCKY